jgi:uncharacterized protein YciI
MTYFLIHTADKVDSLSIRQDNRDAHLAWLRSDPDVNLHVAGPWLDEDGIMRGSLLIVEANSQTNVENWLSKDPYRLAGLTDRTTLQAYHWVVGAPS